MTHEQTAQQIIDRMLDGTDGHEIEDIVAILRDCERQKDEEIKRLVRSRNKWGQRYNTLLLKHRETVEKLKLAVWSDSEECKLLTAENERLAAGEEIKRLKQVLESMANHPTGGVGCNPQTFVEAARAALNKKEFGKA